MFDRCRGRDRQLLDAGELNRERTAAQLGTKLFWCDHDQALELVDGLGAADQNTFPAGEDHPQRRPEPAESGRALLVTRQCLTSCADRVDPIVLRSACPLEGTDLDDRLA